MAVDEGIARRASRSEATADRLGQGASAASDAVGG